LCTNIEQHRTRTEQDVVFIAMSGRSGDGFSSSGHD